MTDEDYKKFYRDLYPMTDEPLFWIHLNVDYPFNLTGILYFPRIKSNIDLHRNKNPVILQPSIRYGFRRGYRS